MVIIMAAASVGITTDKMMSFLSSLIAPFQQSNPNISFDAQLKPQQEMYVIGDVHGCAKQLVLLMEKQPAQSQLVFVGDLIDRGPDSAEVLQIVMKACEAGAICITGNHEIMMLDFLERPTERGEYWIHHGGLQTLASLNIGGIGMRNDDATLLRGRDQLEARLGVDLIKWLRQLPKHWQNGNVHVVHASADPKIPMNRQDAKVLAWGHPNFCKLNRSDGQWVVYGHTIHEQPSAENGRIAVDTGAFATGRLTAAYITTDNVAFIQS